METAFDANFSGVKVHTDGESDQLNKSLNSQIQYLTVRYKKIFGNYYFYSK